MTLNLHNVQYEFLQAIFFIFFAMQFLLLSKEIKEKP